MVKFKIRSNFRIKEDIIIDRCIILIYIECIGDCAYKLQNLPYTFAVFRTLYELSLFLALARSSFSLSLK